MLVLTAPDNCSIATNKAIIAVKLYEAITIVKIPGNVELRLDNHSSRSVDVTVFSGYADNRKPFRKIPCIIKRSLNYSLSGLIDEAKLVASFYPRQAFREI